MAENRESGWRGEQGRIRKGRASKHAALRKVRNKQNQCAPSRSRLERSPQAPPVQRARGRRGPATGLRRRCPERSIVQQPGWHVPASGGHSQGLAPAAAPARQHPGRGGLRPAAPAKCGPVQRCLAAAAGTARRCKCAGRREPPPAHGRLRGRPGKWLSRAAVGALAPEATNHRCHLQRQAQEGLPPPQVSLPIRYRQRSGRAHLRQRSQCGAGSLP